MGKVTRDKIAYERHPVSFERKREMNAQGFRVIDAVFAPASAKIVGLKASVALPSDPPAAPAAITTIPDNWRGLPWIPKGDQIGIRSVASSVAEGPFKNKAEAIAAIEAHMAEQVPPGDNLPNPKGEPVAIPEAWEAMTDVEMIGLALEIVGGEGPLVSGEGRTEAEKAKAIISAEVAERAA